MTTTEKQDPDKGLGEFRALVREVTYGQFVEAHYPAETNQTKSGGNLEWELPKWMADMMWKVPLEKQAAVKSGMAHTLRCTMYAIMRRFAETQDPAEIAAIGDKIVDELKRQK